MIERLPMQADGIVRLSKIEVYPEYLDEYMKFAIGVGDSSQEAYKCHIASPHFQKYKKGTLHMVKSLELCDQQPLNEKAVIKNFIKE